MPRFFRRILSEISFRREADVNDVQRSRRVLRRNPAGDLDEQHVPWRSSFFDAHIQGEEHRALRDGASVADSDAQAAEQLILATTQEFVPETCLKSLPNSLLWSVVQ
ncbi:fad binding domain-containing [Pyrenophora seminiperda CCB06]|uniref:Fad binding domain-containing n=1 Tax=Pyrenophora seminiperda CCB06 TaxID=1302712 RepID=A0A3M7M2Z5_9PLEO|nr:fad binding domain-containing [Pyrenophora seminiperda CCB06]